MTFAFGVTGYSLPWDRIGYWACKIVTSVPETLDNLLPGVGLVLTQLLSKEVHNSLHLLPTALPKIGCYYYFTKCSA